MPFSHWGASEDGVALALGQWLAQGYEGGGLNFTDSRNLGCARR